MAGFDDFVNFLEGVSESRGGDEGINLLIKKANEQRKAEKSPYLASSSRKKADSRSGNEVKSSKSARVRSVKDKKTSQELEKEQEQERERIQAQKRSDSEEVIMKHHGENSIGLDNRDAGNDFSNFNFEVNQENMVQGVILSEILGKPVSKRRHGIRQRRNW